MRTNMFGATLRPIAKGAVALGLAAAAVSASAVQYSLTEVPALAGFANMYATGLNESGQVIGFGYNGMTFGTGPFRLSSGSETDPVLAFVTGAKGSGITAINPLAGYANSHAAAINDAGQVAGHFSNGGGNTGTAFVTDAATGQARALVGLTGVVSSAGAINASGQVAGVYKAPEGQRVFLASPDGTSIKDVYAAPYVSVSAVTDDGRVMGGAGAFGYAGPGSVGYMTGPEGESVQILSTVQPNQGYSATVMPVGINASGQIAGYYMRPGGEVFLRDADGTERVLDFSLAPHYQSGNTGGFGQYGPKTSLSAKGVNAAGQVVGAIVSNELHALGISKAFISGPDGADVIQVDQLSFVNQSGPLDFYFTSVAGINDLGSFVANASNGKAYLISVVPEPATYATMLGGLALMGLAVRRNRRQA